MANNSWQSQLNFLTNFWILTPEDLDRQRLLDDWYGQLARISAQIAGCRASLKMQQEKQERSLRKARDSSTSARVLYDLADKIAEKEVEAARIVLPQIESLTRVVEKHIDQEDKLERTIRRYAEEAIDIATSWLELVQNFRLEAILIASEKEKPQSIISSEDELEREFARLAEDER